MMVSVDIVCVSAAVAAAIRPDAVAHLRGDAAEDLGLALTLVLLVPTMADLLAFRALDLILLGEEPVTDYYFGSTAAGLRMRPVDARGREVATTRTREGLMNVTAVNVLGVGNFARAAESA